jgi:hypothetical protein
MVHAQTLDFVQRNEHSCEEQLVLFFQRQGETVDDRPQNLEEFCNAVETLSLVDELKEDVVDGAADVRSEIEEFTVYAVERRLEEVAFSGVFGVEQLEQLECVSETVCGWVTGQRTFSTKLWSIYALAMFVLKS